MILSIERMNHTGEGIAINNNIIYFIPKTVPGDKIEVQEKDIIHYKNYNKVINYNLIEKSNMRIPINCPYYKDCGGCQLLALKEEDQLKYKQNKVKDIFLKYANMDINPEIIKTDRYKYRNKITLHVQNGILGLYSEKTNKIIPIKKCLLIPDELNNLISIINKINLSSVEKITLKQMQKEIMIQFIGNPNKKEIIKVLKEKVESLYINDTLISGKEYIQEELSNNKYVISPNSFFQINHEGTIALYNEVKNNIEKDNQEVLDLYCGTSSIGIYISEICKNITGIEINPSSVKDAKTNIKLNKINNINIIEGNVSNILKNNKKYSTIIVDPPRNGLDKKTKNKLLEIKSKKIIYISCNPITLARDISDLKKEYNLSKITLVDMFPNTYHVESICLLSKN